MIFRVTIDFDSEKNETFKGMTQKEIMDYISELHPQDDSVVFVSISPICELCKAETKEEIKNCLHLMSCTKSK